MFGNEKYTIGDLGPGPQRPLPRRGAGLVTVGHGGRLADGVLSGRARAYALGSEVNPCGA